MVEQHVFYFLALENESQQDVSHPAINCTAKRLFQDQKLILCKGGFIPVELLHQKIRLFRREEINYAYNLLIFLDSTFLQMQGGLITPDKDTQRN